MKKQTNTNRKTALTLLLLMVLGIFASTFSLAASSVSVQDISKLESLDTDIADSIDALNEDTDSKRIGFTKYWRGFGSIDNGYEGHLLAGFWVAQTSVLVNEDGSITDRSRHRAFGSIRIASGDTYKLVRIKEDAPIDREVSFYVLPFNKKKITYEDADANAIGTLTLKKTQELKGLTKWAGKLKLKEGDLEGSWSVDLATSIHTIRHKPGIKVIDKDKITSPVPVDKKVNDSKPVRDGTSKGPYKIGQENDSQDQDSPTQGKKIGFWKRIFFWRN